MVLRILLGGALAGALGWERHRAGRPAGIRTHALVAMAATAFTLAGVTFTAGSAHDPLRIAAQVVTGIGFIGAGTIFRSQDHVYGLTTAATLWFAAALGVLVGVNLGWVAIAATAIAAVVLVVVERVEKG